MNYLQEYKDFINAYTTGVISAEMTGELIAKLALYYSDYNLQLVVAQKKLFQVARDIESREEGGKTISSAKAQSFIQATEENSVVMDLKAHIGNLESFQSALRSLQRGQLNEYSYQQSQ